MPLDTYLGFIEGVDKLDLASERVDKKKVKDLVGFIPLSIREETARDNIKPSGGK